MSPKKLAELGVWNRTPRNRIQPVSEFPNFMIWEDECMPFLMQICLLKVISGTLDLYFAQRLCCQTLILQLDGSHNTIGGKIITYCILKW